MGWIAWIVLGLLCGALAKWIMPGKDPGGCLVTIGLGIGGAVVGGLIGTQLGWGKVDDFSLGSIALATVGALLLLWVYRQFLARRGERD